MENTQSIFEHAPFQIQIFFATYTRKNLAHPKVLLFSSILWISRILRLCYDSVSKLFTTSTFFHSIHFQNSSINHPRSVSVIPKFILEQQINSDLFLPKDQFHSFSHRNNVDDPLRNILSAAVYFQRCFVASSRSVSFGACRRVRIKGRRPHPRRAKSRLPWRLLSLSVPAITQWSRTRELRIDRSRPPRPNRVSKTPNVNRRIVATNRLVDNTVLSTIVIVIRQLFGGCRQLLSYRNDFVKLCCSLRDTSDVSTPVCMFFSCKAIFCGLQKVSRKFSADRFLVCFVWKSAAQMTFRSRNYIDDLLLWKAIVTRHVKKLEGSFAAISLNPLQSEASVLLKWHLVNR